MSGQTTYNETPAKGFNGQLAEAFSLDQIDSGIAEGALVIGNAVKHGSSDAQFVACAADDAVVGICVYDTIQENQSGDYTYADKAQFPVLSKGRYFAVANGAIAAEAAVGWDPATNKVGAVVGATTTLAFGVAKQSATADGDIIIVEVNF